MSYDTMGICADMTIVNAIESMAMEEGLTIGEARDKILESDAYKCMLDFDSGLWKDGPDYFRGFLKQIEQKSSVGSCVQELPH